MKINKQNSKWFRTTRKTRFDTELTRELKKWPIPGKKANDFHFLWMGMLCCSQRIPTVVNFYLFKSGVSSLCWPIRKQKFSFPLFFLPTKWCFSFGIWLNNIFSNCLQGLKKQSALISVFKERLYWNSVLSGSRSAQTLKKKGSCARLSILWKVNSRNCRQVKKCNEINRRVMYFFGLSKIDKHLVT